MKQTMKRWPRKSPCTNEKDRQTLHKQMTPGGSNGEKAWDTGLTNSIRNITDQEHH